jgi:putative acetyltransferase
MTSTRSVRIRPETRNNESAIKEVTLAAFMITEHSNHNEQNIIRDLREANQLSISLVAEDQIHT